MLQNHRISITTQMAGENNDPIVGRTHCRASTICDIYSIMHNTVADAEGRRNHTGCYRPCELPIGSCYWPGGKARRGGRMVQRNDQCLARLEMAGVAYSINRHQARWTNTINMRNTVDGFARLH